MISYGVGPSPTLLAGSNGASVPGMAADGRRHIIAIGGGMRVQEGRVPAHLANALRLSGAREPRLCLLNTAGGDDPRWTLAMYDRLAGRPVRVSHLALFPMPNVRDPEDLLLSMDVIFAGGGSVANMLAIWRVHGLDVIMRKAWQAGVVLTGSSAGGICWFEGGTTDSFGRELRAFTDGLGLLRGSYCPHYDSEPGRRPLYRRLIAEGTLAGGIACDDGAAAHFTDDTLTELLADRPTSGAYRVAASADSGVTETPLEVRCLESDETLSDEDA
jgi:peptidase E